MFIVDDGSSDNTRVVVESYIGKFTDKGYCLTYIYQENAGQAAAVNKGLKYVKGRYLGWPDSDDYYNREDAISTFVHTLSELDDTYGAVCYIGTFVDEDTLKDKYRKTDFNKEEELFENCLLGGDMLAVPICYMVRMNAFDKVNSEREIYTKQHAQNMQMLLPLFYSYKCRTIHESLCNIVVRSCSDSHVVLSYEKQKERIQGWLDIKLNSLDQITELSNKDRDRYKLLCREKELKSKLELAFNFRKKKDVRRCLIDLKEMGAKVGIKKQVKAYLLNIPFLYDCLVKR
jgi:glycosyltransferase involved in cell wall biosynthesis